MWNGTTTDQAITITIVIVVCYISDGDVVPPSPRSIVGALKGIEPVDETSSLDGSMIDAMVLLGLHFSIVWNTEPTRIRVMATGPK